MKIVPKKKEPKPKRNEIKLFVIFLQILFLREVNEWVNSEVTLLNWASSAAACCLFPQTTIVIKFFSCVWCGAVCSRVFPCRLPFCAVATLATLAHSHSHRTMPKCSQFNPIVNGKFPLFVNSQNTYQWTSVFILVFCEKKVTHKVCRSHSHATKRYVYVSITVDADDENRYEETWPLAKVLKVCEFRAANDIVCWAIFDSFSNSG